MTTTRTGAAVLIALALAASACGSKGDDNTTTTGEVKTGPGVDDKTISLGVLTDTSGVFAALGATVTQGNQIGVDEINAAGGICGRQIKLEVQDHGYDVQRAVAAYQSLEPKVAGMLQLLGSPMTTALLDQLAEDEMLGATATWASTLLSSEYIQISGATYDIEMINGISYLMDEGKIKKGDKIGHIYLEGEYGANGYTGSKYAAEKLGLTVEPIQIKATESDLTTSVGKLKAAGVKAVMLTTSPKQTASAVGVGLVSGLDVPYLGNNPVYSPLLLSTPAGPALEKNLYIMGSASPLSADTAPVKKVLAAFKAKYPGKPTNAGVTYGYGVARIYEQTLKAACDAKDLTRAGLLKAFRTLSNVDTEGIIAPLNYSKAGDIPSRQTLVARPSKATLAIDGLKVEKEYFESETAKGYELKAE